jgi:hypothetical protein
MFKTAEIKIYIMLKKDLTQMRNINVCNSQKIIVMLYNYYEH